MSEETIDDRRESVLFAYHEAVPAPNVAALAEWIARYPDFAGDLIELTRDWALFNERDVAIAAGDVPTFTRGRVLDPLLRVLPSAEASRIVDSTVDRAVMQTGRAAVILLYIDNVQPILRQTIVTIRSVLQPNDRAFRVARHGFALVLSDADSAAAQVTATNLLGLLRKPITLDAATADMRIRSGIAAYPPRREDMPSLLDQARRALVSPRTDIEPRESATGTDNRPA